MQTSLLKGVVKQGFRSFPNPKGKMVILHFWLNFMSNDSILIIKTKIENSARFRAITKSYATFKSRVVK